MSTVNILDDSGQTGVIQMKTWVPTKKSKECTIQVEKVKSEEVRFVKIFAEIFLKFSLEEAIKGNNIKSLFKDNTVVLSSNINQANIKCDICNKIFQESRTLKMHITRMHTPLVLKNVQLRKSKVKTKCAYCSIPFSEESLKKHIETIHACSLCKVVSNTEIGKKRHMRDDHDKVSISTSPKKKKRWPSC